MLNSKKVFVFLFAFFTIFCFTDVAFCANTDIEIKPKTITERKYSDAALTDKYNIEVLTEGSYNQAKEITRNRMLEYEKTQSNLFVGKKTDKNDNNVSAVVSDLGLFKKGYAAVEKDTDVQGKGLNTLLSVLIILFSIVVGVVLSITFQKRKVEKKQ